MKANCRFLYAPAWLLAAIVALPAAGCSREDLQDAAVRMRVKVEGAGDAANASRRLAEIVEGGDEPLVQVPVEEAETPPKPETPDPNSLYAEPQTPFGQPTEPAPAQAPPPSYFK